MVLNSLDIHKKKSWEAVHQKSFFLITCKLVIRKKLVNNQMLNKNHLHCIDVIAYYCNKPVIFKKPRHGQLVIFSRKGGDIQIIVLKAFRNFLSPPPGILYREIGSIVCQNYEQLGVERLNCVCKIWIFCRKYLFWVKKWRHKQNFVWINS